MEGLPRSHRMDVVFVVVDRLTKYVHFIALSRPYSASKVVALFVRHVFKLHGMPNSIVSDRDLSFTSLFWSELMRLQDVQLAMSSSYHPQNDSQTKVVNRSLEQYLMSFTSDKPAEWVEWLPLCQYWFNTNYHISTKCAPFEALYGVPPPKFFDYIPSTTKVKAVDTQLHSRQELIVVLKHNLVQAQNAMKLQVDQHRLDRVFEVGDWVYLRLQPYKLQSIAYRASHKLSPRFYGPF